MSDLNNNPYLDQDNPDMTLCHVIAGLSLLEKHFEFPDGQEVRFHFNEASAVLMQLRTMSDALLASHEAVYNHLIAADTAGSPQEVDWTAFRKQCADMSEEDCVKELRRSEFYVAKGDEDDYLISAVWTLKGLREAVARERFIYAIEAVRNPACSSPQPSEPF